MRNDDLLQRAQDVLDAAERERRKGGSEGPRCGCGCTISRVLQSHNADADYKRRRECVECGARFTSYELRKTA